MSHVRATALAACALLLALAPAHARAGPADAHTWRSVLAWYQKYLDPSQCAVIPPYVEQSELRIHAGDDPRWADPHYDDSGWTVADREQVLRKDTGIFWVRFRVRTVGAGRVVPDGIFIVETAADDFHWDGTLLRRMGRPASSRAQEIAGPVYAYFSLPGTALGPGEHVVALRLSTYRFNRPDPTMNLILLNLDLGQMTQEALSAMLVPVLGVGALCVIGLAAAVFWLAGNRFPGVLLFAGISLGGAVTVFLINVRHLFSVPYSWSYPLWTLTELLAAATAAAMVGLVLVQFAVPRARGWGAAFLALEVGTAIREYLAHHVIDPDMWMIDCWALALGGSLLALLWAAWRRRRGSGYLLATVAAAMLWFVHDPGGFLWDHFCLGMLPVLLAFLWVIGGEIREERRQAREARLTAARLELELLRKSLQPHFLMNTLTALAQAIEESPPRAVRLIEDLAEELRELARFAEQKEVPLEREIHLCRTHLRVMSVRTERPWNLEVEGADADATVPPALFFTLIENGFTHQRPIGGHTAFRLRCEPIQLGARYVFFSPGAVRADGARTNGGSGLRYVKARLEECCTGAWSFRHGPVSEGWETTVELHRNGNGHRP